MAAKYVEVAEIGKIALFRRKGVRTVRMSIAHDGSIRVTLPQWAPYRLGIEFVRNKADWINEKRVPRRIIKNGDKVGKAHRFVFEQNNDINQPTSRLVGTDIRLRVPLAMPMDNLIVQVHAEKAAIRALKKESIQLIPQRLETLSKQTGLKYNSVAIKQLKSRWGSCNERRDIVINCFLIQLPWKLIDYVLLHELTHTKILRHGSPFWGELGKYITDLPGTRKEMKSYQPILVTHPGGDSLKSEDTPIRLEVQTY